MGRKRRELPQWSKEAKKAMIDRNISGPKELAEQLGFSRTHLTAVLNGSVISDAARERICDYLGVRSS